MLLGNRKAKAITSEGTGTLTYLRHKSQSLKPKVRSDGDMT